MSKKEWETRSLEWIHRVRKEIDRRIREQGLTPALWIKKRGRIDIESLCQRLELQNYTIVKGQVKRTVIKQ